jgi:hypothetical protein
MTIRYRNPTVLIFKCSLKQANVRPASAMIARKDCGAERLILGINLCHIKLDQACDTGSPIVGRSESRFWHLLRPSAGIACVPNTAGSVGSAPSQDHELLRTFRSALACKETTTNNSETLRQIIPKATLRGNEPPFKAVMRGLWDLQKYCSLWNTANFDIYRLANAPGESQSALNMYSQERMFRWPDGVRRSHQAAQEIRG